MFRSGAYNQPTRIEDTIIRKDALYFSYFARKIIPGLSKPETFEEAETQLLTEHIFDQPLSKAELSASGALIVRSSMNSHKVQTLRQMLQIDQKFSSVQPSVGRIGEEIDEKNYNALPFMERQSRFIAAVKAYAGRRYKGKNPTERYQEIRDDFARQQIENPEMQVFVLNELGPLYLYRAQDVITSFDIGQGETRLLKPAPNASRAEIIEQLQKDMGITKEGSPESIVLRMYGSEALYEAVFDTGVVRERMTQWHIAPPSEEFLYCMFYGTANITSTSSPKLQEMAARFNALYQECQQNKELTARLREWHPDTGFANPHAVNGGFIIDSIFVERLLLQKVKMDDDSKEYCQGEQGYDAAVKKGVAIVRGEPIAFNYAYRTLLDIVRRKLNGIPTPEKNKNWKFKEIARELASHTNSHVFGGNWYDVSPDMGEYEIDTQELGLFILALLNVEEGVVN